MPDWIAPIDASGAFLDGNGLVPIDAAHRSALPHRGIWLHVLTQNYELLLVRRSSKMATCPDSLSIVGEHMSGREKEEHAARRGIREELPGFVSLMGTPALTLTPLRPGRSSRWFLYDYPLSADGVQRYDRCLMSEFVVRLPTMNSSHALKLLHAGREKELEHEASTIEFVPLNHVIRRLRRDPQSFCAPPLFPSALLDSYRDLCAVLRQEGASKVPIPTVCSTAASSVSPAMPEVLDESLVVKGANRTDTTASAR